MILFTLFGIKNLKVELFSHMILQIMWLSINQLSLGRRVVSVLVELNNIWNPNSKNKRRKLVFTEHSTFNVIVAFPYVNVAMITFGIWCETRGSVCKWVLFFDICVTGSVRCVKFHGLYRNQNWRLVGTHHCTVETEFRHWSQLSYFHSIVLFGIIVCISWK